MGKLTASKIPLENTQRYWMRTLATYLETKEDRYLAGWLGGLKDWMGQGDRTFEVRRGDIIQVQLGPCTFGHELNFPHPAVVLAVRNEWLLIVPCSSKAVGKQIDLSLEFAAADGFRFPTAVLVLQTRMVSRWRIIGSATMGQVTDRVLQSIEETLGKSLFSSVVGRMSTSTAFLSGEKAQQATLDSAPTS